MSAAPAEEISTLRRCEELALNASGAHESCLQVTASNDAAVNLYCGLRFSAAYRFRIRDEGGCS